MGSTGPGTGQGTRGVAADFLLGSFAGEDHVAPSAWSAQASVPACAEGSLRPAGVLALEQLSGTAEGAFHLLTVIAPGGGADLLAYTFDTVGMPAHPPAVVRVGEDGSLHLHRRTERGESRTTYRPAADGFEWVKEFRPDPDAPWSLVVEGRLRRTA